MSDVITIVASGALGIAGGLGSAWFVHWLRRDETKVAIEKTRLDMEQTELQIAQLRKNLGDALKYQAGAAKTSVLYDSTKGFSRFDFETDTRDGAQGQIKLIDGSYKDEVLNLERSNTQGVLILKLQNYEVRGSDATKLPAGLAGTSRRLRAELEARVLGGKHTMLVAVKESGAPALQNLAEWRERLESDAWKAVDAYFEFRATNETYLRILDRSVTDAPSSLQIRRLVVTERVS